ncbi:Rv3235 family protein [Actinokineospora globicatena]|uniref:Rv3235 family protein n=1 Tax=Actinokineospora globicatena TaxID=103729 RepID=UPI0020A487B8|nr:Rv3235 family protein [Actinokineospora globicatena]MCP2302124.1 hypothetical protein [Actinokineospora globicatena]GLW76214.1 hypothetical protein Aglo01_06960 [Actinokineospora globicatena]GLW83050.1 hypothetical protein Aglo02_06900 [Actinokineospora globicatena]
MRINALPDYEPPLAEADEERWFTPPASPSPNRTIRGAPREATWRLVTLLLEALEGKRQVAHLHGMLPPAVYEGLLTRAKGNGRTLYRLAHLHTSEVAPGVVELAATIRIVRADHPDSWHAKTCFGRMEQLEGHWHCTILRLIGF